MLLHRVPVHALICHVFKHLPFLEEVSQFQRVIWQHRLLPYQAELEKEADHYFSNIKSGLAYSVLMRDARPGLLIWVYELDRFIIIFIDIIQTSLESLKSKKNFQPI